MNLFNYCIFKIKNNMTIYFFKKIYRAVAEVNRKRKLYKAVEVILQEKNLTEITNTFVQYLNNSEALDYYTKKNIDNIKAIFVDTFDDICDEYFC